MECTGLWLQADLEKKCSGLLQGPSWFDLVNGPRSLPESLGVAFVSESTGLGFYNGISNLLNFLKRTLIKTQLNLYFTLEFHSCYMIFTSVLRGRYYCHSMERGN